MENEIEEEKELKYFFQFQKYYNSKMKIMKIFNEENAEVNEDWSENIFRAISSNEIKEWENYIDVESIYQGLKNKNKNEVKDEDKEWIIPKIKENIKNKKSINKFNNESIYGSLFNCGSLFSTNNEILEEESLEYGKVQILSNFELITEDAWSLFEDKNNKEFDGKIQIKTGKKKIIIKFKEGLYLIQCPKNYIKDLKDLNNNIIQLIIKVSKENCAKFINKIIDKFPIINDYNENNMNYKIDSIPIKVKKKDIECKEPFESSNTGISQKEDIVNDSENLDIKNLDTILAKEDININLEDIIANNRYINKIRIKNIKNISYIASSIFSLSQIHDFVDYFLFNEKNNLKNQEYPKIIERFREFLNQLWINKTDNYIYDPNKFLNSLKKYDEKIFNFQKEEEPIIFLNIIFNYLNNELNNKDKEIKDSISKSFEEFKNDLNFSNFSKLYQEKFNSIVSKVFYGIFYYESSCVICGRKDSNYEKFDYLELNYQKFYNFKNNIIKSSLPSSTSISLNESFVNFSLEEFIKYYFEEENLSKKCDECKLNASKLVIKKKIYKFPKVLIMHINWGDFSTENGFGFDGNKLIFEDEIDLSDYSFNKNKIIKYNLRSVIYYPVINANNKNDKKFHKFCTINKHLVDGKKYFYKIGAKVLDTTEFCIPLFIPSILFYEKK